jgi:hypothetical protein
MVRVGFGNDIIFFLVLRYIKNVKYFLLKGLYESLKIHYLEPKIKELLKMTTWSIDTQERQIRIREERRCSH